MFCAVLIVFIITIIIIIIPRVCEYDINPDLVDVS